jgi:NADPH2:quinone reductase
MKSLGVVFPEPNRVVLETFDLPEPGPGEVVLEAACSTLSPGTEYNLLVGKSRQTYPIKIGYSFAGRVKQLGPGVDRLTVGQPVVTTGRHASHILADARFVTPVPEGVDLESAAFFNLAHTALFGVRQAGIELGLPVAVLGQGMVGLLAAKLAQLAGATPVIALDLDEERLAMSRAIGLPVVVNAADKGAIAALLADLPGGGVAAAIEATGALEPIDMALDMIRARGRVVLLSSPNRDDPVNCYRKLSMKGASLVGAYINAKPWSLEQTQVGMPSWPPSLNAGSTRYVGPGGWTSDEDVRVFLDLLRYGALDLKPLITHRFTPEQAPEAYELVRTKDKALVGGVIRWS